jgi:hypothetical protein
MERARHYGAILVIMTLMNSPAIISPAMGFGSGGGGRNCPAGGCAQLWAGVTTCSQARSTCNTTCTIGDCPSKCEHKWQVCMKTGGTWPKAKDVVTPGMHGLKPI